MAAATAADGSAAHAPALTVEKAKAAIRRSIRQQQASSVGGWNVNGVRSAQTAQSQGDFGLITRLGRKMQGDPAVAAALDKRIGSVIRSAFTVQPASEDKADKAVAQLVQSS